MFCENCGGKLEPGAKFCVLCGTPVTPSKEVSTVHTADHKEEIHKLLKVTPEVFETDKPNTEAVLESTGVIKPNKSIPRNKMIMAAVAALCVLAVAIGVAVIGGSPEARMNRAIKKGNIKEGYDIYKEKLADESLSSDTVDALIDATADIYRAYTDEKIDQNEVYGKLLPIYDFAYNTADGWSGQNEDIKRVQKKLDYYTYMLDIHDYITEDDPLQTIRYYQQALKIDENGEEAKVNLEKAEESYRAIILEDAAALESSGDLDEAENVLTDALNILQDDTTIKDALKAVADKKNAIIEERKSFEETLDNGWDYIQYSMVCYAYDEMPSDFFREGALPATLEFTSEAKGVIGLVIPGVDLEYRASFVYSVSNNRVILRPDPSGIFPVEDFNGASFIYFDILPDGNLKLVDYAPEENTDLGFTTWNEIFARKEQDAYSLPMPTADAPETIIPVEKPKSGIVGNTYIQSTMISYGTGYTPKDILSEGIDPPWLEFTSETEGIFNVVNSEEVYKASFNYTIEDKIITLVPDTDGTYPATSFSGKTTLYMQIMPDGDLKVYGYAPQNGVMLGFTYLEDTFSLSE